MPVALTDVTKECIDCHAEDNPGLYQQWGASKHYGANVGCYECHLAGENDPDRLRDGIHDDFGIATIVSPLDCGRCHAQESEEFLNSHHSKAGRIMGSLDNMLAEVVEGNTGMVTGMFPAGISAAAVNGCWQCHGSEVRVDPETGQLDPATHTYEDKEEAREKVATLKSVLAEVQNSDDWKWSLNKEDPDVKAARLKRQAEFNDRYK